MLRPPVLARSVVVAALLVAAGCDTDDGRTLDPPVFPPPATTLPAATLPADGGAAGGEVPPEEATQPLQLVAPWRDGATVPARHTCDGEDLSPALTWSNVPPDAVELALTVTDLDAPDFVHWVVSGIPVSATGTAEGAPPPGSSVWPDGGDARYVGPCPPAGETHTYVVTVHALNQQLEPADGMSAAEVIEVLNITSIEQSSVSGTYARVG